MKRESALKDVENRYFIHIKQERAITLIALVVTIVVLLILAAISISMLSGENGIITQAIKAQDENKGKGLEEEIKLAYESNRINEYTTGKNLEQELNKINNATIEKLLEDTFYVEKEGVGYTVYEDGTILEGKIDIWDGTSEVPEISDGNWYLDNGKQLKFLADFVNNGNKLTEEQKLLVADSKYDEASIKITESTTVFLTRDLDLGARHNNGEKIEGNNWTPIGKDSNIKFIGTFDGNNNRIRGIYIKSKGYNVGLFGTANSIKNLTVEDGYIEGNGGVAGIVGTFYEGEISNCKNECEIVGIGERIGGICGQNGPTAKLTNCENIGKVMGKKATGGISGVAFGSIEQCVNKGEIVGGEDFATGGIAGNASSGSSIIDCVNTGKVTGKGDGVAGISGAAFGNVKQCQNSGEIIGEAERVGGIVGEQESGISVTDCENRGKVEGKKRLVGGISGLALGNIEQCKNSGEIEGESSVGGISGAIGSKSEANIRNCYNEGKVIGTGLYNATTSAIGGIIGWTTSTASGTIENNYNKGLIKGINDIGGIIGKNSQTFVVKNCYNKGNIEGDNNVGGVIGTQEGNQNNLSNLYYLKTLNIGAVSGVDNQEKNLKGIENDFNNLQEFVDWLKNN